MQRPPQRCSSSPCSLALLTPPPPCLQPQPLQEPKLCVCYERRLPSFARHMRLVSRLAVGRRVLPDVGRPSSSAAAAHEHPVISVYIDMKSPHSYLALQVRASARAVCHTKLHLFLCSLRDDSLVTSHDSLVTSRAADAAAASRLQVKQNPRAPCRRRVMFAASVTFHPSCIIRWLPFSLSYKDLGVTTSDSGAFHTGIRNLIVSVTSLIRSAHWQTACFALFYT